MLRIRQFICHFWLGMTTGFRVNIHSQVAYPQHSKLYIELQPQKPKKKEYIYVTFLRTFLWPWNIISYLVEITHKSAWKLVLRTIFVLGKDKFGVERILHNEELNDVYRSASIVKVVKSSKLRWARHVTWVGELMYTVFSWENMLVYKNLHLVISTVWFEDLTVVSMKVSVFWVVAACRLV